MSVVLNDPVNLMPLVMDRQKGFCFDMTKARRHLPRGCNEGWSVPSSGAATAKGRGLRVPLQPMASHCGPSIP